MKNFRKACRGEKGFTLIELLVVIIILGVLAAVVTLAVTRFIGKGTLESANAELVTVQAALEACLAESNAAEFTADSVATPWDGTLGTSPGCDTNDDGDADVFAFDEMRTHKFKADYTVSEDGEVTLGDATGGSAGSGWGESKIQWCNGEWIDADDTCS
jgi:prepilin-type N-terminal cleavage/methylation domain-containing protein